MRSTSNISSTIGRLSLYVLLPIAVLAWGGVLLFTRYTAPASLSAFIIFFLLLEIALISTCSPIAYFIGLRLFPRRLYDATKSHALRQGFLLSLVIVLNLLLRALQSWNIFTGIIILAVAIVIEVLSLARK
jgi:hypothetical protein